MSVAAKKSAPLQGGRYKSAVRTPYQEWIRSENVPLVEADYVQSLATIEVFDWPRKGARGVYLNHDGSQSSNDCYVCEIPPGGETNPERYLFEEMVFVLAGQGSTSVWWDDDTRRSFEWQEGSLFAVPLNAWHRHFNTSGTRPARLLAVTSAPRMFNTLASSDFIFGCDYQFRDRFSGEDDYFGAQGTQTGMVWNTNFVPDVRRFELLDYSERGAGSTHIKFRLAKGTMGAHVSEFGVGTYKKAHRHGPGAHVVILDGQGYSLLWKDGEPSRRVDWTVGTLIVPADRTFHQHFNTGPRPARYLALKYDNSNRVAARGELPKSTVSVRLGGDQIDYADEDPKVRELFLAELAKNGVASGMERYWAGSADGDDGHDD